MHLEFVCPYCGEPVDSVIDVAGGARQEYVEDCAVCCRPWQVRVRVDARGGVEVELRRDDDA